MDEFLATQLQIDFRTGMPSAIHGAKFCAEQRSACVALNRIRARGILEADQLLAPGKSLSADVWEALFARHIREWQLPLINLDALGVFHDADGLRSSRQDLAALQSGREACPYRDTDNEVVYKLFDLRVDGSLGKKLLFELDDDGRFELNDRPARLRDTLEKLALLNEVGAHPTEIVGLSDDGHYLVTKQPLAQPYFDFETDREMAVELVKGVIPTATNLRTTVAVIWHGGQTWIVGDLHDRNIMRDGDGQPTIIDALIGPVPPLALKELQWLRNASADAEAVRKNLSPARAQTVRRR